MAPARVYEQRPGAARRPGLSNGCTLADCLGAASASDGTVTPAKPRSRRLDTGPATASMSSSTTAAIACRRPPTRA